MVLIWIQIKFSLFVSYTYKGQYNIILAFVYNKAVCSGFKYSEGGMRIYSIINNSVYSPLISF